MSVMSVMPLGPSRCWQPGAVFDASQANLTTTTKEMATAIGKSERQVERARASLRDVGPIECVDGTRGTRGGY